MAGPELGGGIKQTKVDWWLQALAPSLLDGETVEALVKAGTLTSTADLVAVTPLHLLMVSTQSHCAIKRRIAIADVDVVEAVKGQVRMTLKDGSKVRLQASVLRGAAADAALLSRAIEHRRAYGPGEALQAAFEEARATQAVRDQRIEEAGKGMWGGATVVGSRARPKAAEVVMSHASPGEYPWLVIGTLDAGVLVAFDDRLLLVKTGAYTAFMAGALGGGRVATFNFRDITGIEYNSGLFNGVLEILTPSYDGSANRDFWRGSTASRNADSNDPFTLSNTLPLSKAEHAQALPHLNELRRRITKAKDVNVSVTVDTSARSGLPDDLAAQITRLRTMHEEGVLSDAEFAAAKARLLGL